MERVPAHPRFCPGGSARGLQANLYWAPLSGRCVVQIATEAPLINRNESWIRNPAGAFGVWDRWVDSTGVPVHEGYFVPDMRTIELGWWEERQCNAAFLKLAGFEGLCEARVTEIPPGRTMPPLKVAVDEAVYVIGGRGQTTIWNEATERRLSFEWQGK